MLFCTWSFAGFFFIVASVYWFIPWRRLRWPLTLPGGRSFVLTGDEVRIWWIVAASFYFYASWNRKMALLICATTLIDYGIGLGLEALTSPRRRRALLLLSLVINLGLLCYFKYANFFLESLHAVLRPGSRFEPLTILLPVGISFYTFEAINYTVDVYSRRVPAERNPIHLLFFVLFFPHLIAGPIVRARDFLPQLRRSRRWSWGRFQLGAEYFLLGLLKKWVVADQLAQFADPVFFTPQLFCTSANWIGLLAFTIQVYCDFSGYSDMAMGMAHILGYKLVQNFNMPYLATSVADYWRRNHISLSTWLRDYLFIPLSLRGGRWQSGRWPTCRNLLITMTLGGLWHGASWNFVLWGLLHGILVSVNHVFRQFCQTRPRLDALLQTSVGTALRRVLTFFCIYQGLVLFRATTFASACTMFKRMWTPAEGMVILHPFGYSFFWAIVAGVILFHLIGYYRLWERVSIRLPLPVVATGYVLMLTLCMTLAPVAEKPFIYIQF